MELTTNRQRTAGERKSKLLFGVKQQQHYIRDILFLQVYVN